jgi:hypothetical protein
VVTGSLKNRIQADLGAHVPDAVGASVAAKQNEPGSGL